MSGNSKRRREVKQEHKSTSAPRGFRDVPRTDVVVALGELYATLVQQPGIYYAEVVHDDGCPSTKTSRLSECTCELVNLRTGGRVQ